MPVLFRLFQKIKEAGILPIDFMRNITLILKPDRRKLQAPVPDEPTCKNPQQNGNKLNLLTH